MSEEIGAITMSQSVQASRDERGPWLLAALLAALLVAFGVLATPPRAGASESWQRVVSRDGFYVAWLPAEPEPIEATTRSLMGRTTSFGSYFERGGESCQLTATELPALARALVNAETLYAHSRDHFLRAVGGSSRDYADCERAGIAGKGLEWRSDVLRGRVEFYLHAGRIYVFGCQVAARSRSDLIDRFFDRIELRSLAYRKNP